MFSKLERKVFEPANYHPGAGYYLGNEVTQIRQVLENQSEGFGREKRFKRFDAANEAALGPGQYKIADQFDYLSKLAKKGASVRQNDQQQPIFKVNAIPSIPSNNITTGYQEIGEGLLILMKGNKQSEAEKVGPSTYEPNFNFSKPRAPGFVIKRETSKNNILRNKKEEPFIELFPEQDEIPDKIKSASKHRANSRPSSTISQSNKDSNFIGLSSPGAQNRYENAQRVRERILYQRKRTNTMQGTVHGNVIKESEVAHERDPLSHQRLQAQQQLGEYNLELLVLREKMTSHSDKAPPPGAYYNEKVFSTFKVQQKPAEFQCFDSTAERFQEPLKRTDVGPGEYQIQNVRDAAKLVSFAHAKKDTQFFHVQKDINVAPGQYTGNIINNEVARKAPNQQTRIDYPSVFGSGTQRFASTSFSTGAKQEVPPGPGSYNLMHAPDSHRAKKKRLIQQRGRILTVDRALHASGNNRHLAKEGSDVKPVSSSSLVIENQGARADSLGNTEDRSRNHLIDQIKKMRANKTSAFASQSKRFESASEITAAAQLGPGTYSLATNLTKGTFNQSSSVLPRSPRQKIFAAPRGMKAVGPGTYDANIEAVRTNRGAAIAFI